MCGETRPFAIEANQPFTQQGGVARTMQSAVEQVNPSLQPAGALRQEKPSVFKQQQLNRASRNLRMLLTPS